MRPRSQLVDQVADPTALEFAAVQAAEGLHAKTVSMKRGASGWKADLAKSILSTEFGVDFVLKKARAQVMKQTGGNYPAPLKVRQRALHSASTAACVCPVTT